MMNLKVGLLLCCTFVSVYTEPVQSRSVNVALETVLLFNRDNNKADLKLIDDLQRVLNKIKVALNDQLLPARRSKDLKFSDFLQYTIYLLSSYNDKELKQIFKCLEEEISTPQLNINHDIRRIMTKHIQKIQNTPSELLRRNLKLFLKHLAEKKYDRKKEILLDFIDSIYRNESDKLISVLKNLKWYKTNYGSRHIQLKTIIKNAIRSLLFEQHPRFNLTIRKKLKELVQGYWQGLTDTNKSASKFDLRSLKSKIQRDFKRTTRKPNAGDKQSIETGEDETWRKPKRKLTRITNVKKTRIETEKEKPKSNVQIFVSLYRESKELETESTSESLLRTLWTEDIKDKYTPTTSNGNISLKMNGVKPTTRYRKPQDFRSWKVRSAQNAQKYMHGRQSKKEIGNKPLKSMYPPERIDTIEDSDSVQVVSREPIYKSNVKNQRSATTKWNNYVNQYEKQKARRIYQQSRLKDSIKEWRLPVDMNNFNKETVIDNYVKTRRTNPNVTSIDNTDKNITSNQANSSIANETINVFTNLLNTNKRKQEETEAKEKDKNNEDSLSDITDSSSESIYFKEATTIDSETLAYWKGTTRFGATVKNDTKLHNLTTPLIKEIEEIQSTKSYNSASTINIENNNLIYRAIAHSNESDESFNKDITNKLDNDTLNWNYTNNTNLSNVLETRLEPKTNGTQIIVENLNNTLNKTSKSNEEYNIEEEEETVTPNITEHVRRFLREVEYSFEKGDNGEEIDKNLIEEKIIKDMNEVLAVPTTTTISFADPFKDIDEAIEVS